MLTDARLAAIAAQRTIAAQAARIKALEKALALAVAALDGAGDVLAYAHLRAADDVRCNADLARAVLAQKE